MKSWTDNGWRTWESKRLLYFDLTPMEDYQGDKMFRLTLHLNKRAYQFTHWYHLPMWWQLHQGHRHNARNQKKRGD